MSLSLLSRRHQDVSLKGADGETEVRVYDQLDDQLVLVDPSRLSPSSPGCCVPHVEGLT